LRLGAALEALASMKKVGGDAAVAFRVGDTVQERIGLQDQGCGLELGPSLCVFRLERDRLLQIFFGGSIPAEMESRISPAGQRGCVAVIELQHHLIFRERALVVLRLAQQVGNHEVRSGIGRQDLDKGHQLGLR